MYHFFVATSQIADGYAVITGQDVNHIRNVLRMKAGAVSYTHLTLPTILLV